MPKGTKAEESSPLWEGDSVQWLRQEIRSVMQAWEGQPSGKNIWRDPLAAVAAADDPLLEKLREAVDPQHAMPRDLLPGARAVIVFFLPFREEIGKENAEAGEFAARTWAQAYVATNSLIKAVNEHLQACMEKEGYAAAITPATHNFDEKKLISLWSHKHLGYIAGLGTFGRNHLLITQSGCCGRLGSLATTLPLPPTQRPKEEYCLAKAGYQCDRCVTRCVYGALEIDPFHRQACYAQCLKNDAHHQDLPLVDVCGKCGAQVPCSYRIPVRKG